MTQSVSRHIALMLKEKGINIESHYNGVYSIDGMICERKNTRDSYSPIIEVQKDLDKIWNPDVVKFKKHVHAPKISEVVMWIYKEHSIWITVDCTFTSTEVEWSFSLSNIGNRDSCVILGIELSLSNSLEEAYEKGIEYCLNNLI